MQMLGRVGWFVRLCLTSAPVHNIRSVGTDNAPHSVDAGFTADPPMDGTVSWASQGRFLTRIVALLHGDIMPRLASTEPAERGIFKQTQEHHELLTT